MFVLLDQGPAVAVLVGPRLLRPYLGSLKLSCCVSVRTRAMCLQILEELPWKKSDWQMEWQVKNPYR